MGDPNSTKSKLRNRRNRNYKAERQARLARAAKLGKSRGWAYGHPTVADLPKPSGPIDRHSALEKALARMKHGATQKAAAKAEGSALKSYAFIDCKTPRRSARVAVGQSSTSATSPTAFPAAAK